MREPSMKEAFRQNFKRRIVEGRGCRGESRKERYQREGVYSDGFQEKIPL